MLLQDNSILLGWVQVLLQDDRYGGNDDGAPAARPALGPGVLGWAQVLLQDNRILLGWVQVLLQDDRSGSDDDGAPAGVRPT